MSHINPLIPDKITTTKQSTTQAYAYFMRYIPVSLRETALGPLNGPLWIPLNLLYQMWRIPLSEPLRGVVGWRSSNIMPYIDIVTLFYYTHGIPETFVIKMLFILLKKIVHWQLLESLSTESNCNTDFHLKQICNIWRPVVGLTNAL